MIEKVRASTPVLKRIEQKKLIERKRGKIINITSKTGHSVQITQGFENKKYIYLPYKKVTAGNVADFIDNIQD